MVYLFKYIHTFLNQNNNKNNKSTYVRRCFIYCVTRFGHFYRALEIIHCIWRSRVSKTERFQRERERERDIEKGVSGYNYNCVRLIQFYCNNYRFCCCFLCSLLTNLKNKKCYNKSTNIGVFTLLVAILQPKMS